MKNDFSADSPITNSNSSEKHQSLNITIIRILTCAILLCSIMFIKSSRPCQYESIKFWYQNNFCTEKFDKEYACHLSQSIVQKLKNTSKFIETNLKQIQK